MLFRRVVPSAGCALLGGLMLAAAPVRGYEYLEIARTGTPTPDGGSFQSFSPPAVRDGLVAFHADTAVGIPGIYVFDTEIHRVTRVFEPTPTGGNFTELGTAPDTGDGSVVFWGAGQSTPLESSRFEGIYIHAGSGVFKVADTLTAVPGGSGNFTAFGRAPRLVNGSVIFTASSSAGWGIYVAAGPSSMAPLVTSSAVMPGRTERFSRFPGFDVDGSGLVFVGESASGFRGVYSYSSGGVVTKVVDAATARPGGGTFAGIGETVAFHGGNVAFLSGAGVYARIGAVVVRVADTTMTPPDSAQRFINFPGAVEVEGNTVVFSGSVPGRNGIYLGNGGRLEKVRDSGEAFNGKTVHRFLWGNRGLFEKILGFHAAYTDGTSGVYMVKRLEAPARSVFSPVQKLRIGGSGGFQVLDYNYTLGTSSVTPWAAAPSGAVRTPLVGEQWTGSYLYDYTAGRYSQAVYRYGDAGL